MRTEFLVGTPSRKAELLGQNGIANTAPLLALLPSSFAPQSAAPAFVRKSETSNELL
jgi:hypothetical protein